MKRKNIFLIGFMGSGKSFWGEKLAKELGSVFIDSDSDIEESEQMSIKEMFSLKGEAHFRTMENEWLQSFDHQSAVVSTGGGTAIHNDALSLMRQKGVVIYIEEPFDVVYSRVLSTDRPLLKLGKIKLEELYNERLPIYRQAQYIIKSPMSVLEFVNLLN